MIDNKNIFNFQFNFFHLTKHKRHFDSGKESITKSSIGTSLSLVRKIVATVVGKSF